MKLAHAALASAGLLTMSYAIGQSPSAQPCGGGGPCNAVIVLPSGCGGGIVVAPDPIRVVNKAATINWRVVSPGWTFASNGIVVHASNPKLGTATKAGDTFTVTFDPAGPKASYKYDINLVGGEGKAPCSIDPTIVNY
ncbi:MAG TPA: hypothetical protein VM073_01280 [Usitatibacter sp.]|nr:hypothetical protein [Usitatibacter sp.]